jgi:hypothetical protein
VIKEDHEKDGLKNGDQMGKHSEPFHVVVLMISGWAQKEALDFWIYLVF